MEIELKLGLSDPDALPRLLAALPAPEAVVAQRNHYLEDPEGALAAAGIMLRVREERVAGGPPRVLVTAKRKVAVRAGVFTAEEVEADLDPEVWAACLAGEGDLAAEPLEPVTWARERAPFARLAVRTWMENTRHRIPWRGFLLEVDRTEFPDGGVEVEVEVETDRAPEARAALDTLARAHGIGLFEQTATKYARLLKRVRELLP